MAMANVEDQQDALDARKAQAEANVDVAEFDENGRSGSSRELESPFDPYSELVNNMSGIERYAIRTIEENMQPENEEEIAKDEASGSGIEAPLNGSFDLNNSFSNMEDEDRLDLIYQPGTPIGEMLCSTLLPLNLMPAWDIPCEAWMPPSPPCSEVDIDDIYRSIDGLFFYEDDLIAEEDLPPYREPTTYLNPSVVCLVPPLVSASTPLLLKDIPVVAIS
uniref:Uncharacterized protein n=1 Tax=Ditylenchus dipsaci TaxID=166011 RepID=A0A915EBU0_9BILA